MQLERSHGTAAGCALLGSFELKLRNEFCRVTPNLEMFMSLYEEYPVFQLLKVNRSRILEYVKCVQV